MLVAVISTVYYYIIDLCDGLVGILKILNFLASFASLTHKLPPTLTTVNVLFKII